MNNVNDENQVPFIIEFESSWFLLIECMYMYAIFHYIYLLHLTSIF